MLVVTVSLTPLLTDLVVAVVVLVALGKTVPPGKQVQPGMVA
jgi:hypothetical protein